MKSLSEDRDFRLEAEELCQVYVGILHNFICLEIKNVIE